VAKPPLGPHNSNAGKPQWDDAMRVDRSPERPAAAAAVGAAGARRNSPAVRRRRPVTCTGTCTMMVTPEDEPLVAKPRARPLSTPMSHRPVRSAVGRRQQQQRQPAERKPTEAASGPVSAQTREAQLRDRRRDPPNQPPQSSQAKPSTAERRVGQVDDLIRSRLERIHQTAAEIIATAKQSRANTLSTTAKSVKAAAAAPSRIPKPRSTGRAAAGGGGGAGGARAGATQLRKSAQLLNNLLQRKIQVPTRSPAPTTDGSVVYSELA
jgi:hypothetical protein